MSALVAAWLELQCKLHTPAEQFRFPPFCGTQKFPPSIPLDSYLRRFEHLFVPEQAFEMACVLLDRTGVIITRHTVHRLFLGCLVVSCKYLIDDFGEHQYAVAAAGGVKLNELSALEIAVLNAVNFDVWVDPIELFWIHNHLLFDTPVKQIQESDENCDAEVCLAFSELNARLANTVEVAP